MTLTPGIRIFLVDDHPAVLDGLTLLLAQDRHTICGVAATRAEALERIATSGTDLVLVDLALCGESGLDLLPELSAQGLPVLVYSMHEDQVTVCRALEKGASGYVTKREPSTELLEAVRCIRAGERYVSPRAATSLNAREAQPLSERELQTLNLMAQGETNAEIAVRLDVSVRTVESYCARVIDKLGLSGMKALRKHALAQARLV